MINYNNYKKYIYELKYTKLPIEIILYILHIALYGLNYNELFKQNKIKWKNRMHN